MKYLVHALIFLTTIYTTTFAKPQNVQIEKQVLIKVPVEESNDLNKLPILVADENPERKAKEILDKIGEVNEELLDKMTRVEKLPEEIYNPALNYLNSQKLDFNPSLMNNIDDTETIQGFNDKIPDGQMIKRKIFHKVSYLTPNPSFYNIQGLQNLQNYQTINDDSITTYPINLKQQFNQLPSNLNLPTTKVNQYPWPFAQFFPILIKDPFLSVLNGFTGIIEYGPPVDICSKDKNKPKKEKIVSNRRGKAIDTNTTSNQSISNPRYSKYNSSDESSKIYNLFLKPNTQQKVDVDNTPSEEIFDDSKIFGRRPNLPQQVTNPGFFINRLRVRKGGVAIAGPGGVATAGGGGTAIVGPGGVAYTKPDGMAIVGPGAKIISLPEELDLTKLIEDLTHHQHHTGEYADQERKLDGEYVLKNDGSSLKKIFIPTGGKIVATGPMIYHNPPKDTI